jgi:hypothetical protein
MHSLNELSRQYPVGRPGLETEFILDHPVPDVAFEGLFARNLTVHQVRVTIDARLAVCLLAVNCSGIRPFAFDRR